MKLSTYGEPELFQSFLKSAQYIARIKTQQDAWEELGKLVVAYFPAAWVAFGQRVPGGISVHHCTPAEGPVERSIVAEEVQNLVADVLESGFIASRVLLVPMPSMTAVVPILEEYQAKAVMLIGHHSADALSTELLNIYLAIAGLAGTALERLHSEEELHRHRADLEKLVGERTAELGAAKRQTELILQSVSEGICSLDLEGRITSVNAFAAELTGWDPAELIGRRAHETLHQQLAGSGPCPVEECLASSSLPSRAISVGGEEFRRKDGTRFPVEFTTEPIVEGGRIVGAVLVFRDITERKHAEESLLREKAFSETAINSMPGVFYLFREGGKLLRWNRNFEEVTGYCSHQIREMSLAGFFDPHDKEIVAGAIGRVFEEGRTSVEASFLSQGGHKAPYYLTGFRMLVDGVPYLIGSGIDITELKRAQDRLRDAQKLESLGVLAGGLAHDFNNLLVGVIGNASLAQDALPTNHPAFEMMARVVRSGEQAAHLTRQMLAYSGKGRFLVEPLNISELIPEISSLVQPSISKKIALQLDLKADLPPVDADRGQMQQVFMNLVLNAAEAIGSSAGLISARTGVRELGDDYVRQHPEAVGLRPGTYVEVQVADTGCGMDDATKARIFDPFFSTKFTGRGLGLAAVAGIVRGHKGAIEVTSERGRGSRFNILFPAAERAAEVRSPAAGDTTFHGTGTILVVDDEEAVREVAKQALTRYGFSVLLADSGLAAIDVFKREPRPISLVLLDLSMPGMSGEEVLPELRRIRPEVKVVVSSGYAEAEAMRIFDGHRVSGFIQKPYTFVRLAEKVQRTLG